jgi:hypothetical protein
MTKSLNGIQTASREGHMRIVALGLSAILAVCVADSAVAAKKKVATPAQYDKCYQDAVKAGALAGQSGHREFMMQCLYGIVTGRPTGQ